MTLQRRGRIAIERRADALGEIDVPATALWGAQTQRSLQNFDISGEQQPREIIRALALVKRASAVVNQGLGLQDGKKTGAIVAAADEVIAGQHPGEFPLVVWQTGSGTQTNMNVNEVIAGRANELLGAGRGGKFGVHGKVVAGLCRRGQSRSQAGSTSRGWR